VPKIARSVPGFLTNVELDQALGSSRTRQRWEADGLLPRGRWIKGFQKRLGIYPDILLARVVAGVDAQESEDAVREAMRVGARLIDSRLFESVASLLEEHLGEYRGLTRGVLDHLAEADLLAPLEEELAAAEESLEAIGIAFQSRPATVTTLGPTFRVVDGFGAQTLLPAAQVLGIVEAGEVVALEEVRVGARGLSYVLPTATTAATDPAEEIWAEMFAGVDRAPVVIPVLADDKEPDANGGDVVRMRRRIRVDLPLASYAANSMTSRSRAPA
jgi:hypothetical protein